MLQLEFGVVKQFNNKRGDRSGSLVVLDEEGHRTDEELKFRYSDAQFVELNEERDDLVFIGPIFPRGRLPMPQPKVGDKIAFQRDKKGEVNPWTRADGYTNRLPSVMKASV